MDLGDESDLPAPRLLLAPGLALALAPMSPSHEQQEGGRREEVRWKEGWYSDKSVESQHSLTLS